LLVIFTQKVRVVIAAEIPVMTRTEAPSTISQLVIADLPIISDVVGEAL